MEAQEIKVQKILEMDLLIDQDYPSDPILQKCYVWYVVISYNKYFQSVIFNCNAFLAKKVKQPE